MILLPFIFVLAEGLPASCHAIEADQVLARDVAAAVPAFAQLPPDFLLGYVATTGAPKVFHGADLERIAKNRGIELHDLPEVCFARTTFIPTEDQIREAMNKTLGLANIKIEVVASLQHAVPSGKLEFPKSGIQPSFGTGSTEIMWRGSVRYGDTATAPVWARVKITAPMTRVVATADLASGKPISASQVRLEACEDSPLDETVARSLDEVVGYLARSSLRQTTVIHKTQIERAPDVARGDDVIVDVFEGFAHLRIEARAESSGIKGSVIVVRNTASGKDFHAQVTGKGTAAIGTRPSNGEME